LIASVPTALIGGFIVLNERLYDVVTGLVLLLAAILLFFRRAQHDEQSNVAPLWALLAVAAIVGFVSGLTGVGGGVFLAPILIWMNWATPKQTAALSAPFILANSAAGLAGAYYSGQMPAQDTWLYAITALLGAVAGAAIGLRWMSQAATQYALAAILATAGVQLLML
jgi:uncharacterized membrane protein YfcA